MSRVEIAEEILFLILFSDFFRTSSEKLFRLLAKKLQEVFITTFYVSRGTVCGLELFLKFWIVLDFLQKTSAWFSKFYLRVQSKNCGRKHFFCFFCQNFFGFWAKISQTFGQKTSKSCQNYLLRVQRNNLWLESVFKSFESLWISCRNLWHGSHFLSTCPE